MLSLVQFNSANGKTVTTSLIVADVFGKRHTDVLRDIRNLSCSDDFRKSNFGLYYYMSLQNKNMPYFEWPKTASRAWWWVKPGRRQPSSKKDSSLPLIGMKGCWKMTTTSWNGQCRFPLPGWRHSKKSSPCKPSHWPYKKQQSRRLLPCRTSWWHLTWLLHDEGIGHYPDHV